MCKVSLMAESVEPEESFLEACARNGFGTLSKTMLVELARYVEADVTACDTLFAVSHELLRSIFPGATEHEILNMLSQLCPQEEGWLDMLDTEACIDLLENSKDDEHKETITQMKEDKDTKDSFRSEYGCAGEGEPAWQGKGEG